METVDFFQCLLAVAGHVDLNARPTQYFQREFAVHVVVLDQQNVGASQCGLYIRARTAATHCVTARSGVHSHRRQDTVIEGGGRERLDEQPVDADARFLHLPEQFLPAVRRDHHAHGQSRQAQVGLDTPDCFHTIYGGHMPIHQYQPERLTGLVRLLQHFHGLKTVTDTDRFDLQ